MKNKIEIIPELNNYRELIDYAEENYKENIAYKYKENTTSKPVEKTYKQTVEDVKALSTALLNKGLSGKKIALIGSNRYEW